VSRAAKTSHLQIRVSPAQKADLVRRARASGLDLSSFVLQRVAPETGERFAALVRALAARPRDPFVLAEISDLLESLGAPTFRATVESLRATKLDDISANLLAAMVDTRAARLGLVPPDWVEKLPALRRPWFPTELMSVRLHLLCNSPPAFRRRNLFIDSTLGDRV
jgi:hypothetical protein